MVRPSLEKEWQLAQVGIFSRTTRLRCSPMSRSLHWINYAIVSRILNTTTLHPLVIAAGITQYGTMAAGEFLSNPEYFAQVVPQLPRGWEKKNLQIVLRVPVVNRVAGRPQVLAVHVW